MNRLQKLIREEIRKILREGWKSADPTVAAAASKVKSHISTIRGADLKKYAQSYWDHVYAGEPYPTLKEFGVEAAPAAQVRHEIDDIVNGDISDVAVTE